MYVKEDWLRRVEQRVGDIGNKVLNRAMEFLAGGSPLAASGGPFFIALFIMNTISNVNEIKEAFNRVRVEKSLYNLTPILRQAREAAKFWSPLGPGMRGKSIAVGVNGDGRLEVFARGADDCLYHRWQISPNAPMLEDRWSNWELLDKGPITSDPAVIRNMYGTLLVFVRGADNVIYHKWQSSPGTTDSRNWNPLAHFSISGTTLAPENLHTCSGNITAFKRPDQSLIVLALGGNKALHFRWQNGPGVRFFDWEEFRPHSPTCSGTIAIGNASDGSLVIFARRADNRVLFNVTLPNSGFGEWELMDGVITSDPVMGRNADSRLAVFARGTNNAIYCRSQISISDSSRPNWSNWQSLGGILTSNVGVGTFTADKITRMMIVGRGVNNTLHYKFQLSQNDTSPSNWSDWARIETPPGLDISCDPLVANNADGSIFGVFVVCSDKAIWFRRLGPNMTTFSRWEYLGAPEDSSNPGIWTPITVYLSMVSLETGELRFVTESGQFRGSPREQLVGLPDAIIASSAIPAIFPPVKLNGQNYVDGGVLETIPVHAAIEAGADEVYAISASTPKPKEMLEIVPYGGSWFERRSSFIGNFPTLIRSYDNTNLFNIAWRSINDIMTNGILQKCMRLPVDWPKPVTIIEPTIEVHDSLTIKQGLISIAIDYGYMRAFDILEASNTVESIESTDEIIRKRRDTFLEEAYVIKTITYGRSRPQGPQNLQPSDDKPEGWTRGGGFTQQVVQMSIEKIRQMKRDLWSAVSRRFKQGFLLPPGNVNNWWNDWEKHYWSPRGLTPWSSIVYWPNTRHQAVIGSANPPPPI
jgi:predicted acylesterase/phospholipase RssA